MTESSDVVRAIRRLQWFTVGWMTAELTFATIAGIRAHSVALIAFGADSGIELISAATVLCRFGRPTSLGERMASKITGWLLVLLALYIATAAFLTLLSRARRPEGTYFGVTVLIAAAIVMPIFGRKKRHLARSANSPSLRADAAQSMVCGYMSLIALAGVLLNTFFRVSWADPIAALALLPIVLKEAKEALQGDTCSCNWFHKAVGLSRDYAAGASTIWNPRLAALRLR